MKLFLIKALYTVTPKEKEYKFRFVDSICLPIALSDTHNTLETNMESNFEPDFLLVFDSPLKAANYLQEINN